MTERSLECPFPQGIPKEAQSTWTTGHAENENNNRCDELAVAESRKYL